MSFPPTGMPEELTAEELQHLDPGNLVDRILGLQRAYHSLLNVVNLYRRQLAATSNQALRTSQIADLFHRVNIADLDVITNVAARDMPCIFEADFGALFLYDPDTKLLTLRKSHPEEIEQPALHLENDADVMLIHCLSHRREPLLIESFKEYEQRTGREFRSVPVDEILAAGALICPLFVRMGGEEPLLIGALIVAGKAKGFTQEDVDVASIMGEMLSTAISTSRLIERMSRLAETDGLTELFNHRHFQQELDRAVATTRRYDTPLCMVMIDMDHFKEFNDAHGHQVGDHILRETARVIRLAVRDVDIAARYGGEEFAVIMPQTDLEGARIAGERIRAAIESSRIAIGGEQMAVTISAGVAELRPDYAKGDLIDAADRALYRAKRGGRNRVEVANGLLESDETRAP